ncbi:MAG: hypothetical protein GY866_42420 [Proteobacteria bacterium]|nr:hypothetical protein [Pseudomonadota bacterium]
MMAFTKTVLKVCFILALGSGFSANAIGQIVTPSLDPTEPVLMPSASGWRESMSVGVKYLERSGNRKLDGSQVYQLDSAGYGINTSLNFSNFFLDAYYGTDTTDVQGDPTNDGPVNLDSNDSRLNFSLAGDGFVTIGLGGRVIQSTDFADASNDSVKATETRTIGSISIKTFDMFFIGLGYERVKESGDYAVNLNWNNMNGGVAMKLGDPGGVRLRLEYSLAFSSKVENDAQGDRVGNVHPKTSVSYMAGELMFSGLLFAVKGEETKMEVDLSDYNGGEGIDEVKITKSQAGVLWIPGNGLTLGFYFVTDQTTANYIDKTSEFRIHLGYLF